jgi:hypothetical protein
LGADNIIFDTGYAGSIGMGDLVLAGGNSVFDGYCGRLAWRGQHKRLIAACRYWLAATTWVVRAVAARTPRPMVAAQATNHLLVIDSLWCTPRS